MILTLMIGTVGILIILVSIVIGIRYLFTSSATGGRQPYYPPQNRRRSVGYPRQERQPYQAPRVAIGQAPGSCSGASCERISQTEFERRRDLETAQRLWEIGGEELQARYRQTKPTPVQRPVIKVYPPEPNTPAALPAGNRGALPEGDRGIPMPMMRNRSKVEKSRK